MHPRHAERNDGAGEADEDGVELTDQLSESSKTSCKLDHLHRLVEEHPLNGQCWYDYAVFLHEQVVDGEEVIRALLRAQSFLPEKDLRLRLGDVLVRDGRIRQGLRQICEFLAEHPTAFAYRLLGRHLTYLSRKKRARKFLRKSLVLEPNNQETYYLLGELVALSAKRESVVCYRKAIAIDPTFQRAWRKLGSVLTCNPDTAQQGIEASKRAIELDGDDAWSMMWVAEGYRSLGQPAMADVYYRNALLADPTNLLYQEHYASFCASAKGAEGGGIGSGV
jgi:tetratricopeptide (TPR) repeat protein